MVLGVIRVVLGLVGVAVMAGALAYLWKLRSFAYHDGLAAGYRGVPLSICPYWHPSLRKCWQRGWVAGLRQANLEEVKDG